MGRPNESETASEGARHGARASGALVLGVFGAEGSFSEEAGIAYARREGLAVDLHHEASMEALLAGVGEGALGLAVLPVVNTMGGLVRASFEAMGRRPFLPVGQITLGIEHCLLVRQRAVARESIARVVSHPQALVQCERFLDRELPGIPREPWNDTASAARGLAEGRLEPDSAVIASRRAGELFGLSVWREGVQDAVDNRTTFVVVGPAT